MSFQQLHYECKNPISGERQTRSKKHLFYRMPIKIVKQSKKNRQNYGPKDHRPIKHSKNHQNKKSWSKYLPENHQKNPFCLPQAYFHQQLGSYLRSDKTYIVVNSVCTGSNHVILWRWKSKQKAENSVTHLSSDSGPSKPGGQEGHFPHQILADLEANPKALYFWLSLVPPTFSDLPPPLSLISHQSSVIVPTSAI